MLYSSQFSQNISDYSGHSTSKNTLWKPLAAANRRPYRGVCVAVLQQDYQKLDLLCILTFYWHNLYLCSKLYPKLLVSWAASILYWFFFLNDLPQNHSAFVVWQRRVAQVISISLLKMTCFKERKGHLFNSSNHYKTGNLAFFSEVQTRLKSSRICAATCCAI